MERCIAQEKSHRDTDDDDADNALVAGWGNVFSDFRFNPARIDLAAEAGAVELTVRGIAGGLGEARPGVWTDATPELAAGSCFGSLSEARDFLKYRPRGLSRDSQSGRLKLAEVFRDETQWLEQTVRVAEARWAFLESLEQRDLRLESATRVAPIDYQ